MRYLIEIDGASFYDSHYKKLSWSIRSQDEPEKPSENQQETKSTAADPRQAMRDHLAQLTERLETDRGLVDYEVAVEFTADITDRQKEEFTRLFNEVNTREEPNWPPRL